VAEAVSHPLVFPPGTAQQYNGTGYYLAGLLIEHLTGHSYADEVRARVIRPLRLTRTYVPDRRDPRLPGPHAHGYVAVKPDRGRHLRPDGHIRPDHPGAGTGPWSRPAPGPGRGRDRDTQPSIYMK
jgi:D-alanyl-D-alanine carboxypeptidase